MFSPSKNLKSKICVICAERFETSHANALCCSKQCKRTRKNELQNQKHKLYGRKTAYVKKQPEERICVMCEDTFYTAHYSKRTCSKDCARLLQNRSANAIQKKDGTLEKGTKIKKKIPNKYLVRGTIHGGNRASSMSCNS